MVVHGTEETRRRVGYVCATFGYSGPPILYPGNKKLIVACINEDFKEAKEALDNDGADPCFHYTSGMDSDHSPFGLSAVKQEINK